MQTNHPFYSPDSDATSSQTSQGTLKYVHVKGQVTIEVDQDSKLLKLTFVDSKRQPLPKTSPIFFKDSIIMLKNVHLVAQVNETYFSEIESTLKEIDPKLKQWAALELSDDSPEMNPTGPPPTGGGGTTSGGHTATT